ncbi:serine hydrolase domain-containing protein [Lysobacter yananisis]|uniref:Serine hydrolase domain-containing protein n=1 Tax=Lysobacter yananisis TaxID=1003114 RepID=A0ABY9P6F2_9GAMM|nr:serine hydrolase domain-containing protein [Lysobacter yananisis]WMT01929.1 serine hydrolase domain-containing protein [Lysobacter yananisis]
MNLPASAVPAAALSLRDRVDDALDRALAERRLVGAVVLVARDGEPVYRRAAGQADRESDRLMREDTIFLLASVTKPFVAAVALKLAEQGRIDLDAPVTRWLPQFRPQLADGSAPEISLRQLLAHRSGLSYRFGEAAGSDYDTHAVSDGFDQPGLDIEENLRRLGATRLRFAPDTGFKYSLGLDVLGEALARATGTPLPQLVQELIAAPLAMADTGFQVADYKRLAAHYSDGVAADGSRRPLRMHDGSELAFFDGVLRYAPGRIEKTASYPSGGAGMAGSAGDVLKLLEALRRGGGELLAPESAASMLQPHTPAPIEGLDPGWGYGYGAAVLVDPVAAATPQSRGTFAWGGVYGHSWFIDPQRGLSVVALTNTALEGMSGQFTLDLRDAVYAGLDA